MTRSVPIVFVGVTDPVGAGFVESLARVHAIRIRHQRKVVGNPQAGRAARNASGSHSRCGVHRMASVLDKARERAAPFTKVVKLEIVPALAKPLEHSAAELRPTPSSAENNGGFRRRI
jgi:hypothetical protein